MRQGIAASAPTFPRRMLWLHFLLYNLVLVVCLPVIALYLLAQQMMAKHRWRHGGLQRLGWLPRSPRGKQVIWAHAVSVGEAVAVTPIVRELRARCPEAWLLVTTLTDTGQKIAQEQCAGVADRVAYLPVDLLPCVALALARVRPEVLMLTETELWPNLLHLCRWFGTRVVVVNARISDRNMRRMRWPARWFFAGLLALVDRFCAQSEHYLARAVSLGLPPEAGCAMGNAKMDSALTAAPPEKVEQLGRDAGVHPDDQVLVAGSTHQGEEELVLAAFCRVRTRFPACRLILAPRHIHRAEEVEAVVARHGLTVVRRSTLSGGEAARRAQVILLDTMGELAAAYALGQAAFVGGSLIETIGGHNVLEPTACGRPVLYGPHMYGQLDLERAVREAKLGWVVQDAESLASAWIDLLASPERLADIAARARAFAQEQRGVAARYAALVAGEMGG